MTAARRLEVVLHPGRVRALLLVLAGFFVGTSLVSQLLYRRAEVRVSWFVQERVLNVDTEQTPAVFFSSAVVLGIALLLWMHSERTRGTDRRVWQLLALVALAVAVDESTSYHERLGRELRDWLDISGALTFAWVIPAIGIIVLLALVSARTVARLAPTHRRPLLMGAALMVGGAVGLEMVGGVFSDHRGSLPYLLTVHLEEGLEMVGAVVLLTALLGLVGHPTHGPAARAPS